MMQRKFVVAHVQQRLPATLMMMENTLWFTIGVLLGLIVLFHDGSTILS
jgi:hypothetical protein